MATAQTHNSCLSSKLQNEGLPVHCFLIQGCSCRAVKQDTRIEHSCNDVCLVGNNAAGNPAVPSDCNGNFEYGQLDVDPFPSLGTNTGVTS